VNLFISFAIANAYLDLDSHFAALASSSSSTIQRDAYAESRAFFRKHISADNSSAFLALAFEALTVSMPCLAVMSLQSIATEMFFLTH